MSEFPGTWRVSATHSSGSLDTAVAQLRRRNLAVSFSILALLGASMGMVLISSARAQRLAQQQLEFVSTVSHELRTPLAVICSAGENLADGVVRDADQLKNYGQLVRNEGRRLADMVEQVLSFAGIQSGKKFTMVPTNVNSILDSAVSALAGSIRENGFVVERRLPIEPVMVMADSLSLDRALQNVLANAMKFSEHSRHIEISVVRSEGSVRIAIADRGIGISASDLPHIFEPFYRGRSAVERQIRGSGLGLSLVQEIVKAHGGLVEVASSSGEGSTFSITLPEAA